jgi:hypothetical protein
LLGRHSEVAHDDAFEPPPIDVDLARGLGVDIAGFTNAISSNFALIGSGRTSPSSAMRFRRRSSKICSQASGLISGANRVSRWSVNHGFTLMA